MSLKKGAGPPAVSHQPLSLRRDLGRDDARRAVLRRRGGRRVRRSATARRLLRRRPVAVPLLFHQDVLPVHPELECRSNYSSRLVSAFSEFHLGLA